MPVNSASVFCLKYQIEIKHYFPHRQEVGEVMDAEVDEGDEGEVDENEADEVPDGEEEVDQ